MLALYSPLIFILSLLAYYDDGHSAWPISLAFVDKETLTPAEPTETSPIAATKAVAAPAPSIQFVLLPKSQVKARATPQTISTLLAPGPKGSTLAANTSNPLSI